MPLFKFDLTKREWTTILPQGKQVPYTVDYGLCVYNDKLYAVLGSYTSETFLYTINLESGSYEIDEIFLEASNSAKYAFSYSCHNNYIHLYGG
jgi:hypothetical protein